MHLNAYAELRLELIDSREWEILRNWMGILRVKGWMDQNLKEKGYCYLYSLFAKCVIYR